MPASASYCDMSQQRSKSVRKQKTIIIAGAALGGATAAARAREIDEHARIILLERNTRVSYAMAGLSLHLSGEVRNIEDLNREREDFFRNVYAIDVRTRTEVKAINAKKNIITIETAGTSEDIAYDALVMATGAASIAPIGIKPAASFSYFRTLDDLAAIKAALVAGKKRFVVLGGGSMGAEAFDGLVRAGAEVTLIEKKRQILPDYSAEISALVTAHEVHKARIIAGFKDMSFETAGDSITAVKVDGVRIETDFVVSAIGVKPRTELLKKTGVKLSSGGAILIDEACRTSVKDIYACSICVAVKDGKEHHWIPQAAVSDKTAQVAGENAAGGKARLAYISGSQIIRLPSLEVGRVGKKPQGSRGDSVFVHARDIEAYVPGSAELSVKLWYDKKTLRVKSLEAAGRNIKSRLDTFAAALAGGLTLNDLAMLDLAYTPAFGTARDAVNIAATVALQKSAELTATVTYDEIRAKRGKFFVLDVSAEAAHAGFHDLHVPLEKLRSQIVELTNKFKISGARHIATLSATGRRGHLALRILRSHGLKAVNIAGGRKTG